MHEIDYHKIKQEVRWKAFWIAVPIFAIAAASFLGVFVAGRACGLPPRWCSLLACFGTITALWIHSAISGVRSKRKIGTLRQAMGCIGPVQTTEEAHPWLDSDSLRNWVFHLGPLGFIAVTDYTVATGGARIPGMRESFTRLMVSDSDHCFAEISQSCRPGEDPGRMACALTTLYASGEDCRTSSASPPACAPQADCLAQLMRNHFYAPGASAMDLLRLHLEQRDRVAAEQGFIVRADLSYVVYVDHAGRIRDRAREWAGSFLAQRTGKSLDDL